MKNMSVMREGRRRKLQEKLMQRDGMILPIVLLSIAVIASTILFVVIPGYQEHLRNARIQADVQSVATARDVLHPSPIFRMEEALSSPITMTRGLTSVFREQNSRTLSPMEDVRRRTIGTM